MAFNLGKKLSGLFAGFAGASEQDNQPAPSVYAAASPDEKAEYDACVERLLAANLALKTIYGSPEYKSSSYAKGEYALRGQYVLMDKTVEAAARFKAGNPAFGDDFPDMTTAIISIGKLVESTEDLGKTITSALGSARKAAPVAKPATP